MRNLHSEPDFFKTEPARRPQLFKCFCTRCDIDFLSDNKHRKLCRYCAGPTAMREVRA
jgi:hypothetical protein